jgi:hypothetical protein
VNLRVLRVLRGFKLWQKRARRPFHFLLQLWATFVVRLDPVPPSAAGGSSTTKSTKVTKKDGEGESMAAV